MGCLFLFVTRYEILIPLLVIKFFVTSSLFSSEENFIFFLLSFQQLAAFLIYRALTFSSIIVLYLFHLTSIFSFCHLLFVYLLLSLSYLLGVRFSILILQKIPLAHFTHYHSYLLCYSQHILFFICPLFLSDDLLESFH